MRFGEYAVAKAELIPLYPARARPMMLRISIVVLEIYISML